MSASRQLSAVLFIDIAGYTAIMQEDEALALATVGFFRDTLQEAAPKWRGHVIQFYGDGCLLIFNSAVDAVQFSIEVQAAFKKDQPVPARIGLHLGDIILKEGNVFGDPVNIAARIQALAAPGQIFLSGTIHQAIANKKEFTTRFIREENLKNVKEAVPVYELVQDGQAVPVIKKKRRSNTGRSVKTNVMIAASVILIAILAFIGTKFLQGRSSVIENSIAVLPFVDMSKTQDQEYFGDGLAEQIINSLTTVNELKVIGRTSSFQFKGQNLDLRKIGKTLNVGLILEGSIQVDGKKLRITAQLIRVSDNTHVWSQQYDRELTEIFRIQDDIALQITERLKIALTDQQKQRY